MTPFADLFYSQIVDWGRLTARFRVAFQIVHNGRADFACFRRTAFSMGNLDVFGPNCLAGRRKRRFWTSADSLLAPFAPVLAGI